MQSSCRSQKKHAQPCGNRRVPLFAAEADLTMLALLQRGPLRDNGMPRAASNQCNPMKSSLPFRDFQVVPRVRPQPSGRWDSGFPARSAKHQNPCPPRRLRRRRRLRSPSFKGLSPACCGRAAGRSSEKRPFCSVLWHIAGSAGAPQQKPLLRASAQSNEGNAQAGARSRAPLGLGEPTNAILPISSLHVSLHHAPLHFAPLLWSKDW